MSKIYIIGSINLDLFFDLDRFPESGETLLSNNLRTSLGGKGLNQAVAAARTGGNVSFIGSAGKDDGWSQLSELFTAEKIDFSRITQSKQPTGTAIIALNKKAENMIIIAAGANDTVSADQLTGADIQEGDVFVSQLEIPQKTILESFKRAKSKKARTLLNAAPMQGILPDLLACTDILIVNEIEFAALVGCEETQDKTLIKAQAKAFKKPEQSLVITLGKEGLIALHKTDIFQLEAHPVEALDTTGAGDCFVGTFASMLSKDMAFDEALIGANKAASLSVAKYGSSDSMPYLSEIDTEK
ncbi:MAG TPA: ribokinase [Rhodospirillaceae bacterium]|nr:ribokinase [Rhodospirillaceae bacterium]